MLAFFLFFAAVCLNWRAITATNSTDMQRPQRDDQDPRVYGEICHNMGKSGRYLWWDTCECLYGTSGKNCEIVEWCTKDNMERCTKAGANCSFDPARLSGVCACEEGYGFDETKSICKAACRDASDCANGANCVEDDENSKYCACRAGTSGDQCSTVDWCVHNGETCASGGAQCLYDPDAESGFCACTEADKKFDARVNLCREPCSAESWCDNAAACVEADDAGHRFCDCGKGTSGDKCGTIDWCTANEEKCTNGGAECTYNSVKESGFCKCTDTNKAFDENFGTCRAPCTDDTECANGGSCVDGGTDKFCECKAGMSGDRCETVDWCVTHGARCTRGGAQCQYDPVTESVFCKCLDPGKKFQSRLDQCIFACEAQTDCHHGGICHDMLCYCRAGTSGDKCEIVDWCTVNGEPCTRAGGECTYDSERRKAFCKCWNEHHEYDENDQTCKAPGLCGKDSDCLNFGKCDLARRTCDCMEGLRGDHCEVIDWCVDHGVDCERAGGQCDYDYHVTQRTGFCRCNGDGAEYDLDDKKCKGRCKTPSDCGHNGTCLTKDVETSYCHCTKGTSGPFCDDIDWCKQHWQECVNGGALCKRRDLAGHSISGFCECNDVSLKYDEKDKQCKGEMANKISRIQWIVILATGANSFMLVILVIGLCINCCRKK